MHYRKKLFAKYPDLLKAHDDMEYSHTDWLSLKYNTIRVPNPNGEIIDGSDYCLTSCPIASDKRHDVFKKKFSFYQKLYDKYKKKEHPAWCLVWDESLKSVQDRIICAH